MRNRLMDWLNRCERIITGITATIMFIISVLICYQVFARYVLKNSPFWVEETSVTGMMWIGLLGAAACVWTDSHMNLELVVGKLPKTAQVWMRALAQVIVGLFGWFLLQQGAFLTSELMDATSATIPVSLGVTYLVLPISGGLMVVFAFVKAIKGLVDFYNGKGEEQIG